MSSCCSPIEVALEAYRRGFPLVVMDDEDRENEGDLIMAAEFATTERLAFILRHTTGIICAPMTTETADALMLPPMVVNNEDPKCTAFTVSCDLIQGTSTGVSAYDRAMTLRALADPCRTPQRFHRPGHIFPLRARPGGVLERRGHTEACVDLCQIAGMQPVGVIGELMHDDGTMMRFPACVEFAKTFQLHIITIEALVAYRETHQLLDLNLRTPTVPIASATARTDDCPLCDPYSPMQPTPCEISPTPSRDCSSNCLPNMDPKAETNSNSSDNGVNDLSSKSVELAAECVLPVERGGKYLGVWQQKVFVDWEGNKHIAMVFGDIGSNSTIPVLTRVHSECFTGDLLGSRRCDCGPQLDRSFHAIFEEGRGVIVYCGGHEGRGIGLINKIKAYKLQTEQNLDTYEANLRLGFPVDLRSFEPIRAVLVALGITQVELLTNNPLKVCSLHGLVVKTRPLKLATNPHNHRYITDKRAFERNLAESISEMVGAKLDLEVGDTSCVELLPSTTELSPMVESAARLLHHSQQQPSTTQCCECASTVPLQTL